MTEVEKIKNSSIVTIYRQKIESKTSDLNWEILDARAESPCYANGKTGNFLVALSTRRIEADENHQKKTEFFIFLPYKSFQKTFVSYGLCQTMKDNRLMFFNVVVGFFDSTWTCIQEYRTSDIKNVYQYPNFENFLQKKSIPKHCFPKREISISEIYHLDKKHSNFKEFEDFGAKIKTAS